MQYIEMCVSVPIRGLFNLTCRVINQHVLSFWNVCFRPH